MEGEGGVDMAEVSEDLLRFKEYVWQNNPAVLHVEPRRHWVEFMIPGGKTIHQDFGNAGRRIFGEGAFTGADALEQASRLEGVFQSGGGGMLRIPGSEEEIYAIFFSMEMWRNSTKDAVFYRFEFRENGS